VFFKRAWVKRQSVEQFAASVPRCPHDKKGEKNLALLPAALPASWAVMSVT
jgi:hypothetical protein